jgi:hypothetical protein
VPGTVAPHGGLLRVWAAVSTPVLIGAIVVLLTRPTALTFSGFAVFAAVFAGVEAVGRGRVRLAVTVLAVAGLWTVVAAGVVLALLRSWQSGVAVLLALTAFALLVVNLRELSGRRGRRELRGGPSAGVPQR